MSQERQLSLLKGPRQRGTVVRSQASEDELQIAIVDTFLISRNKGWKLIHVPNGGLRDKATAYKFERMGVHPGVPDILLIGPDGQHYWLELKTKYGRVTDAQLAFGAFLTECGVPYRIAYGYDDAIRAFKDWGAVRVSL